jgi:hypothetical protein
MGAQIRTKLNWLQHNLPEGLVVDAAWLERQGYSRGLRNKYVIHGWLDPVGRSVYRRPVAKLPAEGGDETLAWQNVVMSLQTLLESPFLVGGRTALELQGFAHYLSVVGPREIHLYGEGRPPGWVSKLKLDTRLVFHNAAKLWTTAKLAAGASSGGSFQAGLVRQPGGQRDWPLIMASPERAILELLDEVPLRETFHQADMLMEGLRNLSPRRLQVLLAACRSVKVKRLFFWFGDRHRHGWLGKLDRGQIDLGSGKRMLVRGGKLDTKYNITVPEHIDAGF